MARLDQLEGRLTGQQIVSSDPTRGLASQHGAFIPELCEQD